MPIAVAAGVVSAGLANPAYAHGGDGALTPLSMGLGAGGLMTMILAALLSTRGHRRTGVVVFTTGVLLIALAGADIAADTKKLQAPESVRVQILRPANDESVESPVRFDIRIVGGGLIPLTQTEGGPTDGHLHVVVDGRTVDMPVTENFSVQMPPGNHVVQIEFTGPDHRPFDPPIQQAVRVRVLGPGEVPVTDTAPR